MKSRVATPLELSCTLLPSCCIFFSLCLFRLYLDSVWFVSARRCSGPETGSLALAFVPAKPSFFRGPSSTLSPRSGPTRLSATRVYIGPGWWGPRQNDEQVKVLSAFTLPPSGVVQTRQFDSRGKEKDGGTVRTNTRKANGGPYNTQTGIGAYRNEAERERFERLTGLEDLSKQNPNLSSSHVLRAEREVEANTEERGRR